MPVTCPPTLEHTSLERPALSDILWRYMDFTKFVSMLVKKGLFFSRLDRLGDEYEGGSPNCHAKAIVVCSRTNIWSVKEHSGRIGKISASVFM